MRDPVFAAAAKERAGKARAANHAKATLRKVRAQQAEGTLSVLRWAKSLSLQQGGTRQALELVERAEPTLATRALGKALRMMLRIELRKAERDER